MIIDDNLPLLSDTIIAEDNETNLSMIDKILYAMNWRIVLEGDGTIRITNVADSVSDVFDNLYNDILEMDITITNNWFDVPNVFRAVGSGISSIARDEDPDSPFSIQNRGREIWMGETDCVLNDGEKITEYAERRLKEEQNIHKTLDYSRRYKPDIHIGDAVWISYPEQQISGAFVITSQTINLGYGGSVSEQAEGI